jgi:hypothetical protein
MASIAAQTWRRKAVGKLGGSYSKETSMLRQVTAFVLVGTIIAPHAVFAVGGRKASYHGGTAAVFAGAKDPIEGSLDTSRPDVLVLAAEKKPFKGVELHIPYASIVDLEYGQKAGRRVGAAAATTVLLGPIGLLSLFSKKRKHYLTIGYKDDSGTEQVVVLELGKDIVRTTLPIVSTRSGQEIEYQDEEARKAAKG